MAETGAENMSEISRTVCSLFSPERQKYLLEKYLSGQATPEVLNLLLLREEILPRDYEILLAMSLDPKWALESLLHESRYIRVTAAKTLAKALYRTTKRNTFEKHVDVETLFKKVEGMSLETIFVLFRGLGSRATGDNTPSGRNLLLQSFFGKIMDNEAHLPLRVVGIAKKSLLLGVSEEFLFQVVDSGLVKVNELNLLRHAKNHFRFMEHVIESYLFSQSFCKEVSPRFDPASAKEFFESKQDFASIIKVFLLASINNDSANNFRRIYLRNILLRYLVVLRACFEGSSKSVFGKIVQEALVAAGPRGTEEILEAIIGNVGICEYLEFDEVKWLLHTLLKDGNKITTDTDENKFRLLRRLLQKIRPSQVAIVNDPFGTEIGKITGFLIDRSPRSHRCSVLRQIVLANGGADILLPQPTGRNKTLISWQLLRRLHRNDLSNLLDLGTVTPHANSGSLVSYLLVCSERLWQCGTVEDTWLGLIIKHYTLSISGSSATSLERDLEILQKEVVAERDIEERIKKMEKVFTLCIWAGRIDLLCSSFSWALKRFKKDQNSLRLSICLALEDESFFVSGISGERRFHDQEVRIEDVESGNRLLELFLETSKTEIYAPDKVPYYEKFPVILGKVFEARLRIFEKYVHRETAEDGGKSAALSVLLEALFEPLKDLYLKWEKIGREDTNLRSLFRPIWAGVVVCLYSEENFPRTIINTIDAVKSRDPRVVEYVLVFLDRLARERGHGFSVEALFPAMDSKYLSKVLRKTRGLELHYLEKRIEQSLLGCSNKLFTTGTQEDGYCATWEREEYDYNLKMYFSTARTREEEGNRLERVIVSFQPDLLPLLFALESFWEVVVKHQKTLNHILGWILPGEPAVTEGQEETDWDIFENFPVPLSSLPKWREAKANGSDILLFSAASLAHESIEENPDESYQVEFLSQLFLKRLDIRSTSSIILSKCTEIAVALSLTDIDLEHEEKGEGGATTISELEIMSPRYRRWKSLRVSLKEKEQRLLKDAQVFLRRNSRNMRPLDLKFLYQIIGLPDIEKSPDKWILSLEMIWCMKNSDFPQLFMVVETDVPAQFYECPLIRHVSDPKFSNHSRHIFPESLLRCLLHRDATSTTMFFVQTVESLLKKQRENSEKSTEDQEQTPDGGVKVEKTATSIKVTTVKYVTKMMASKFSPLSRKEQSSYLGKILAVANHKDVKIAIITGFNSLLVFQDMFDGICDIYVSNILIEALGPVEYTDRFSLDVSLAVEITDALFEVNPNLLGSKAEDYARRVLYQVLCGQIDRRKSRMGFDKGLPLGNGPKIANELEKWSAVWPRDGWWIATNMVLGYSLVIPKAAGGAGEDERHSEVKDVLPEGTSTRSTDVYRPKDFISLEYGTSLIDTSKKMLSCLINIIIEPHEKLKTTGLSDIEKLFRSLLPALKANIDHYQPPLGASGFYFMEPETFPTVLLFESIMENIGTISQRTLNPENRERLKTLHKTVTDEITGTETSMLESLWVRAKVLSLSWPVEAKKEGNAKQFEDFVESLVRLERIVDDKDEGYRMLNDAFYHWLGVYAKSSLRKFHLCSVVRLLALEKPRGLVMAKTLISAVAGGVQRWDEELVEEVRGLMEKGKQETIFAVELLSK